MTIRLFDGPTLAAGAESFSDHQRRLGPLPALDSRLIEMIARIGLVGRGGAGFPVAVKWQAVLKESRGDAVVLVNGAECEPLSKKDRALMGTRPHLILDGAFAAARALRARRVVLYIGERHAAARDAMLRAVAERPLHEQRLVSASAAPARYVAGQESAAIHLINEGVATPTTMPPYPFVRGIDRAPTLVQNVETLAQVGLIARTGQASGTTLVTVAGGVRHGGVLEMEREATVGEAIARAGGHTESPRAILLGGYFGSWLDAPGAFSLPLDPAALKAHGLILGCGVVGLLGISRCPVCETAGMMRYLAVESSAQCGPCFFGLRSLADACIRISEHGSNPEDLHRLQRWSNDVRGRGACKHPDGAVSLLQSALHTFAHEFSTHAPHRSEQKVGAA